MEYAQYENTISGIRKALAAWKTDQANSSSDSPFWSFKIELSFDNWIGYYGSENSSSYSWFRVANKELFKAAFIAVLNRNAENLLAQVANELEAISTKVRNEEVQRLKNGLAKLEKEGE